MADSAITVLDNVLQILKDYRTDCDLLGFTCNAEEVQEIEEEFKKFIEQQKLNRNPRFVCLTNADGHLRSEEDIERDILVQSLSLYPTKHEVVKRGNINKSRLYRRLNEYNITNEEIDNARYQV